MHYFLYTLNFIAMIGLPILLGWLIARKRSIGWRLFFIGSGTFIISQIGHLPFNAFLLPRINDLIVDFPVQTKLFIIAAFLGLSAAAFEETARYLAYRNWARNARSWGAGLMLGAGHGGAESIALGIIVGMNTLLLFFWQNGRLLALIPERQEPIISAALSGVFSTPWYMAILGALERLLALIIQLSLSLMVMFSFIRRKWTWFALAIACHALVDGLAVYTAGTWGPVAAELLLASLALVSFSLIFRMKQPEPVKIEIPSPRETELTGPLQLDITHEHLESSRYLSPETAGDHD